MRLMPQANEQPFEERVLQLQQVNDGNYLEAQWENYDTFFLRELCGLVWALFADTAKGRVNGRKSLRVLEFGCGGGVVFKALTHNLGHLFDFSFHGVDPDLRALGFVQAKFPSAQVHAADLSRFEEILAEAPIEADLCIASLHCYAMAGDDVQRLFNTFAEVAPRVLIADQTDNFDGDKTVSMLLQDDTDREYDAACHPYGTMMQRVGYEQTLALATSTPFKSISGYGIASTKEELDRERLDALMSRARVGDFAKTSDAGRPQAVKKINDISFSINDVIEAIRQRDLKSIAVYGDEAFYELFSETLDASLPGMNHAWFSSNFAELEDGAMHLNKAALRTGAINLSADALSPYECIVVGGASARLYYPRLLRLMGRAEFVVPVFPVGENWEFCVSQVSFPAELDEAQAYLFNHFQEYFGVRDPILARLEIYDQDNNRHEDWVLLQPYESIRIDLNERLPGRSGASMITAFTTAPFLTRGRHYRWRFCIDALWNGSLSTLHGSHDISLDGAGTEFIQARSSVGKGQIVFTLPNHYSDMSDQGIKVECVDGDRRFFIERDRKRRIEQVTVPGQSEDVPQFGDFVGCRFNQYTTPFWFAMEDRSAHKNLSANHIQGHAFEFLQKPPPARPRGELEKSLCRHKIITWPYGVPILPPESGLEMGFSFDSSWPVIRQFTVRYFDHGGDLQHTRPWTKEKPGLIFTDDLIAETPDLDCSRTGMLLVAPDWEAMDLDQQANGISPIVDFAVRCRATGDYDITEFQNCWRNLGVVIPEMPHWIHFSNHLLGGTNLYGRALAREGWRVGALLVNGSGNLNHDTDIDFTIKLFNKSGEIIEHPLVLSPFTHKLVWLDEVFENYKEFLKDENFGAVIIRSKSGDLNGQLVTTAHEGQTVSLQHMWGY